MVFAFTVFGFTILANFTSVVFVFSLEISTTFCGFAIREFKHDGYGRRQTAKITSHFLFFSCDP